MIYDGISLLGAYHNVNQDSFLCKKIKNGYILALSDGLGSKSNSQFGSKAICRSILNVFENKTSQEVIDKKEKILSSIHEEWLFLLNNRVVRDCYATLLFCVIIDNFIIAARLGDGFLSIKNNNQVTVLFDRKEDYFLNQTDCMCETLNIKNFEYIEMEINNFEGVIACSDGIGINPSDEEGYGNFTLDFILEYKNKKDVNTIKEEIYKWLNDWPGRDDKTIAFLLNNEE